MQSLRGVGKCFCTSAGLGQVANGCNGRISQEGRDRDRAVNLGRKAVQVVKYSIQYRKDVKEDSWRGLHLVNTLPPSINSTHNHLGLYQATLGTREPLPQHPTHPPCDTRGLSTTEGALTGSAYGFRSTSV